MFNDQKILEHVGGELLYKLFNSRNRENVGKLEAHLCRRDRAIFILCDLCVETGDWVTLLANQNVIKQ